MEGPQPNSGLAVRLPPIQIQSAPTSPAIGQRLSLSPHTNGSASSTFAPQPGALQVNGTASRLPGSLSPRMLTPSQSGPVKNGQPAGTPSPLMSPSPETGAAKGFADAPEYAELTRLMKQASPQIVRQVVRDHWTVCLLGSEYHAAFVLNAMLHQATPATLDRAVQDFGQKMVQTSKGRIIQHLTTEDLDEVADLMLSKCSSKFLDQALARRLETVPARQLVNALARAERLGYDVEDIVEDKSELGPEHVYPSGPRPVPHLPARSSAAQVPKPPGNPLAHAPGARPVVHYPAPQGSTMANNQLPPVPSQPLPVGTPQQPRPGVSSGVQFCARCGRPCSGPDALHHHTLKNACEHKEADASRFNKDICPHCGCHFGSNGGLYYHRKTNVCGVYTPERLNQVLAYLGVNTQTATPTQPLSSAPKIRTPAPAKPETPSKPMPSSQLSTPSDDPYASLTPDQRANFDREMQAVEAHYGDLMRKAMQDGRSKYEQEEELAKLKNRFNTKQSMTRKKYGIRLRSRRSKAQLGADHSRIVDGATPDAARSTSKKRSRADDMDTDTPTAPPVQRVPLSEMGGLSNPSATAEHVDPTAFLTPSQPRLIPDGQAGQNNQAGTSAAEPMQIDDDENKTGDSSPGTDSGSDEGDIPASLPNGQVDHAHSAQMNMT